MHSTTNAVNTTEGDAEVTTAELAGFWTRSAAYVVDVLILAAVCWGISLTVGRIITKEDPLQSLPLLLQASLGLFGATSLVYFPLFWKRRGQTLGKMTLGIKVIRTDASSLTWEGSMMRFLGYVISWATLSTLFVWIAFDARRQGIHDKMANTYVIVVPKKKVRAHRTQAYAAAERA